MPEKHAHGILTSQRRNKSQTLSLIATDRPIADDHREQKIARDDRVKIDMDPEDALRALLSTPPRRERPAK